MTISCPTYVAQNMYMLSVSFSLSLIFISSFSHSRRTAKRRWKSCSPLLTINSLVVVVVECATTKDSRLNAQPTKFYHSSVYFSRSYEQQQFRVSPFFVFSSFLEDIARETLCLIAFECSHLCKIVFLTFFGLN
jgi:hypothetical protein